MLFVDDAPVELVALDFLFLELGVAPRLEGGEALIEPARAAAIEPDGRAGQVGEQPLVVADQREGRARLAPAPSPATRWRRGRDGWSARRAAEFRDRGRARGRAPRGALRRPTVARDRRVGIDAEIVHQRPRAIGVVLFAEAARARNRASSHSPSDRAPAADSAGARWAGRSASRRRRRLRRPRSSAASTCPSRCARPARCGRPAKSSVPRPRAAARRRGSGGCLAIAIEAAYEASSARRGRAERIERRAKKGKVHDAEQRFCAIFAELAERRRDVAVPARSPPSSPPIRHRFPRFHVVLDDLLYDYSKQRIDARDASSSWSRLAERRRGRGQARRDVPRRSRQFDRTARRAAHRVAQSSPASRSSSTAATSCPRSSAERAKMLAFAADVREGRVRGALGQPMTDVVNIGIGGSDLGPAMATRALCALRAGQSARPFRLQRRRRRHRRHAARASIPRAPCSSSRRRPSRRRRP